MTSKKIIAIPKLTFDEQFSRMDLSQYQDYGVFISILDPDNLEDNPNNGISNFLQVRMWDIEEDIKDLNGRNFDKPSDTELQKIVDFVNKHKDKQDYIVHCSAGISRSGAVVRFLQEKLEDVDMDYFRRENRYIQPNLYILKRLKELDK